MKTEVLTPREKAGKLRKITLGFGVLSLVGLLDSVWLLILHVSKGSLSGVCSVAPNISCDALYNRDYSEWFGIPIPVFSILYFGFLIAVCMNALRSQGRQVIRPYVYLSLTSWVGAGSALYMMYVALILLKTFCPFCAVLWLVLIASVVLSFRMLKVLDQPWGYLIREDLRVGYTRVWFWMSALISITVLITSHFVFHPGGTLTGPGVVIVGEEARTLGSQQATLAITVYSDFQCPWCKVASEVVRQLAEEMPGRARVSYKFYPLDNSCNRFLTRPMHQYSCKAAVAAYCASVQGKFWIFHDYLFTSQDEYPEERFLQFARNTQLDLRMFDACRQDRRALEEVKKNILEGNGLGVQGTPTIFINGRKYSGPMTLSGLKEAVAELN